MRKILILSAKPRDKGNLYLHDEFKIIKEKLNPSDFSTVELTGVYVDELLDILKEHQPSIVHFCGHGDTDGLTLLDKNDNAITVPIDKLSDAFQLFKGIECVILNACNSKPQAYAVSHHVKYVIGMDGKISDAAALKFTSGFYIGLDYGTSYKNAFDFGRCQIGLENELKDDQNIPYLYIKDYDDKCEETKIVVSLLIGAGVSDYLGLPNLDDLLKQATIGDDFIAERIRNTRNVIDAYKKRKEAVFEELISKLRYYQDVSEMLRVDNTFRNELNDTLPSNVYNGDLQRRWYESLTRCYRILVHEYGPKKVDIESKAFKTTLKLIEELARLNSSELDIYTTNYDCSFQVLASNCHNLKFLTHVDNQTGYFTQSWHESVPSLKDSDFPSIKIHRFHGCVAWFCDDRRQFGVIEEMYGSGGGNDLNIRDDDYLHGMAIKLASSQSIGTNPAFSLAFEEFSEQLKKTNILLVWGYSFRDLEILRYINQAFSQQSLRAVLYIDAYMHEQEAVRNLKNTLGDAPISVDLNFQPQKIDWTPYDGHEELVARVIKHIKNKLNEI